MHSGPQDLVTLLYRQVTNIDGRYILCLVMDYLMNNLWQGETPIMIFRRFICSYLPFVTV